MKRMAHVVLGVLLLALPGLGGCYGKFALTRSVYDANSQVTDKYARSAVTIIFVIIPVYEVSAIVDFLVLNVIEFWSGKNPVGSAEAAARSFRRGTDEYVQVIRRVAAGTEVQVEHYASGVLVDTLVIRHREAEGTVALVRRPMAGGGETIVAAPTASGLLVTHVDPAGRVSRTFVDGAAMDGAAARLRAAIPMAPTWQVASNAAR